MFKHDKLDLKLPKGWNQCSKEQLETIASIYIELMHRASTQNRQMSERELKLALFFALTGIKVLSPVNPRLRVEEQYYECSHPDLPERFNLYLYQIDYWINGIIDAKALAEYNRSMKEWEKMQEDEKVQMTGRKKRNHIPPPIPPRKKIKGQLDWITDPDAQPLVSLPYEYMVLTDKRFLIPFRRKSFAAPAPFMDGFSWQRYRFAHDYFDVYLQQYNRLLEMQKDTRHYSDKDIFKQEKTADVARSMFLATIFCPKNTVIDTDTGRPCTAYAYVSNQHSDNASYFRHFPDVTFQVILFWWSGCIEDLRRTYPHCFKRIDVTKKPVNPFNIYARTTATMEKHLGIPEDKVNKESYRIVLQHLEDMAKEAEELKRRM